MVSSFHLTRSARLLLAHPMNTDKHGFCDSLTEQVLSAVFEVSNTLGTGFLEKVYERALLRELGLRGIRDWLRSWQLQQRSLGGAHDDI